MAEEPVPEYQGGRGQAPNYGGTDDGVYRKLQRANSQKQDNKQFARDASSIVLASVWFTIIAVILLIIPVSAIVIGALYFKDCPMDPMIPVWSIVVGCGGVLSLVILLIQQCCVKRYSMENRDHWGAISRTQTAFSVINFLIQLFLIGWFCYGNFLVFRRRENINLHDEKEEGYCNEILYKFCFVLLIVIYVLLCMICCFICILCLMTTGALFANSANTPPPTQHVFYPGDEDMMPPPPGYQSVAIQPMASQHQSDQSQAPYPPANQVAPTPLDSQPRQAEAQQRRSLGGDDQDPFMAPIREDLGGDDDPIVSSAEKPESPPKPQSPPKLESPPKPESPPNLQKSSSPEKAGSPEDADKPDLEKDIEEPENAD